MAEWRLLNSGNCDGYFNMAVDEAIFLCVINNTSPSTLRFYGWSFPSVSFGYFQKINEVKQVFSAQTNFIRRITGGGAVYHNKELTFSIICKSEDLPGLSTLDSYKYISEKIIEGLQTIGIEAELYHGKMQGGLCCFTSPQLNDVVVGGIKLYGGAQRRRNGVLLHQGSIMLNTSLFERVKSGIINSFMRHSGIKFEEGALSEDEFRIYKNLLEKYKSEAWNNRY